MSNQNQVEDREENRYVGRSPFAWVILVPLLIFTAEGREMIKEGVLDKLHLRKKIASSQHSLQ